MNTLYQGVEVAAFSVAYTSQQECLRAVRRVRREGEYSFDHWSWRPPTVNVNVIHHPDYVELQYARAPDRPADGDVHYWTCFRRDGPSS